MLYRKRMQKKVYIIKPANNNMYGLGALIIEALKYIQYADIMGYMPVVDWRKNTQYSDNKNGKKNAWEYFFKDINGIDIETRERLGSQFIEAQISDLSEIDKTMRISKKFDSKNILRAKSIYDKYFKISDLINSRLKSLDFDGRGIAGLYLRGTDYTILKPKQHAIQPDITLAIKKMDYIISKYNFSRVFLVTEDKNIFDEVHQYYGNKLISFSFDRHIQNYTGYDFLANDVKSLRQLGDNARERGINYFIKLILLAKCECMVGGNTCGSWVSTIMSESYREKYIFNLGEYT